MPGSGLPAKRLSADRPSLRCHGDAFALIMYGRSCYSSRLPRISPAGYAAVCTLSMLHQLASKRQAHQVTCFFPLAEIRDIRCNYSRSPWPEDHGQVGLPPPPHRKRMTPPFVAVLPRCMWATNTDCPRNTQSISQVSPSLFNFARKFHSHWEQCGNLLVPGYLCLKACLLLLSHLSKMQRCEPSCSNQESYDYRAMKFLYHQIRNGLDAFT